MYMALYYTRTIDGKTSKESFKSDKLVQEYLADRDYIADKSSTAQIEQKQDLEI